MIRFMRKTRQRWMSWVIARVQEDPPMLQQPRAVCEHHAAGCYICPREHCNGMLNDRDDPDPTKPRPSISGQCIYTPGVNGGVGMRFNMALQDANEYYKKRAMDQGYSDISTQEMIMVDWARMDAAASTQTNATATEAVKRESRPSDAVW